MAAVWFKLRGHSLQLAPIGRDREGRAPSTGFHAGGHAASCHTCRPAATQVPFLFKYTIDSLTADPTALTPATVAGVLALTPPALIMGYGVARAGASFCNEARNAVFAKVR